MAENPSDKQQPIPDQPQYTGGWRKPQTSAPVTPTPAARQRESGWRVPTLPQNVQPTPAEQGQWHLPRPEDTQFTTEDVIEITPEKQEATPLRPEDFLFATPTEAEAPPAARPEDSLLTIEDEAKPETSNPTALDLLDTLEEEVQTDSLLALEQEGEKKPAEAADEADDDAFSMSELMALTSLTEKAPKPDIVPKVTENAAALDASTLSPAERAALGVTGVTAAASESQQLSQTGAEDPGAYARRQLEALNNGGQVASPAASVPAQQTTADPAAYARQQLDQLGGAASPVAATPAPALTPKQQELADKFRNTEIEVRALRQTYNNGQITRDQLQEQLKRLMVLDESSTWWMLGAETDKWYRFENNQWVIAEPPYLAAARTPTPTATQDIDPSQVIGGSLPYFPSEPVRPIGQEATQPSAAFDTGGFGITEELGLPRQGVPIRDPERTVAGTAGTFLNPVAPDSSAPTLQGMGGFGSQPTVVNPAVNVGYGNYGDQPAIASPIPAEDVSSAPAYDVEQPSPTFESAAERQQQRTVRTLMVAVGIGFALILLSVACVGVLALTQYNSIAAQYQPQIAALANYQPGFQTVRVLDAAGNEIAELNSQDGGARTSVPFADISPFMIHAVVSLENERFFDDPGWDVFAIVRAFIQNVGAGQVESGASGITQQVAEKLILKQPTTTAALKLDEIIIASQIAQQYTKQQILEIYLNEVFFGNQSYGVEAAARFYFGVGAKDLNLPQAAMLAGIIASPAQYNPVNQSGDPTNPQFRSGREETLRRMDFVIQRMQQVGCLTFATGTQPFCIDANVVRQNAVTTAQVKAREFTPRAVELKYPHFVQFVIAQVEAMGYAQAMYTRGFIIRTTLNPAVQDVAQAGLAQTMARLINTRINTGSVMVTDPRSGAIRAMVGSPNFNDTTIDGQVNGALTFQQPGSAIKPIVYAGAFEGVDDNGDGRADRWLTPASILWDVQTTFAGGYTPVNFSGTFTGPVAARYALQNSLNIPAVKAYSFIGDAKFADIARRMGLRFPEGAPLGLPSGIGATEITLYDMMGAYATLASNGVRAPLYAIESITDANGNPIEIPGRAAPAQVIQPQVAFLMANILSDDTARQPAFPPNGTLTIPGIPVGAKTGTTNDARDLWTMGFTTNAVVGVWLGRPDNGPSTVTDGGYGSAAPLWNAVMRVAAQNAGYSVQNFPNPPGLVQTQICIDTGTLPPANCSAQRTEIFIDGQPPPGPDQAFVQVIEIDTWSGLRVDPAYCPDNRLQQTVLNINDPSAVAWLNTALGQQFARRIGITSQTLTAPPSGTCNVNTEIPIARITSPTNTQQISGVIQVIGTATANLTFSRFQLEYANAAAPTSFTQINQPVTTPQNSGLLGTWDTASVPNGSYILRLAMFSNQAGGYLYRTVNVTVLNQLQPTLQPTLAIPTLSGNSSQNVPGGLTLIAPTQTPLPFEPINPGG